MPITHAGPSAMTRTISYLPRSTHTGSQLANGTACGAARAASIIPLNPFHWAHPYRTCSRDTQDGNSLPGDRFLGNPCEVNHHFGVVGEHLNLHVCIHPHSVTRPPIPHPIVTHSSVPVCIDRYRYRYRNHHRRGEQYQQRTSVSSRSCGEGVCESGGEGGREGRTLDSSIA
jgi:hypothetical protein